MPPKLVTLFDEDIPAWHSGGFAERRSVSSFLSVEWTHWVTPNLSLGGRLQTGAAAELARQHGISRVVDVRLEEKDDEATLRAHGMTLLHLPTADRKALAQAQLDEGVTWVAEQLRQGHKVHIHCEHGVGRSALLVSCVLVSLGHAPTDALRKVKRARPQVSPSPDQLKAFMRWAERWREGHPVAWSVPTFEELEDIAYSHLRTPPAHPS